MKRGTESSRFGWVLTLILAAVGGVALGLSLEQHGPANVVEAEPEGIWRITVEDVKAEVCKDGRCRITTYDLDPDYVRSVVLAMLWKDTADSKWRVTDCTIAGHDLQATEFKSPADSADQFMFRELQSKFPCTFEAISKREARFPGDTTEQRIYLVYLHSRWRMQETLITPTVAGTLRCDQMQVNIKDGTHRSFGKWTSSDSDVECECEGDKITVRERISGTSSSVEVVLEGVSSIRCWTYP